MEKLNLKELQAEAFDLHCEIVGTSLLRRKRQLMKEENVILGKIRILQMEHEANREESAKKDLHALLTDPLLFVSINRKKQTITKDLTVELIFNPCKHKKRIKIQELLRGYTHTEGKRVPLSEQNLYMQWKLLFEMDSSASGSRNCEQCQKEKTSIKAKWGRWNNKPIGVCHFSVGKLHA